MGGGKSSYDYGMTAKNATAEYDVSGYREAYLSVSLTNSSGARMVFYKIDVEEGAVEVLWNEYLSETMLASLVVSCDGGKVSFAQGYSNTPISVTLVKCK